jgi:hypothetical protein
MLITMILGALAGAGATWLEPPLRQGLENLLLAEQRLSAAELRLMSLALCLLAAAVLAWLFTHHAGAVPLAFGAVLGVLIPRAVEGFRAAGR